MYEQNKGIQTVQEYTCKVLHQLRQWKTPCTPWFRGDSDVPGRRQLLPRIFSLTSVYGDQFKAAVAENYLVQSFRRRAGGFKDTPPFGRTDLWLFLAQHYNVPTRLLDWTESALNALFFAINRPNQRPTVHMLNPRQLNYRAYMELFDLAERSPIRYARLQGIPVRDEKGDLVQFDEESNPVVVDEKGNLVVIPLSPEECFSEKQLSEFREQAHGHVKILADDPLNYPLTLVGEGDRKPGYVNIAPAWEYRNPAGISTPTAFPATHQDTRMIAQRSCFTCHGSSHEPLDEIVDNDPEIIVPLPIDIDYRQSILRDLMVLGTTQASIFPDLDSVGRDLEAEVRSKIWEEQASVDHLAANPRASKNETDIK